MLGRQRLALFVFSMLATAGTIAAGLPELDLATRIAAGTAACLFAGCVAAMAVPWKEPRRESRLVRRRTGQVVRIAAALVLAVVMVVVVPETPEPFGPGPQAWLPYN